MNGGKDFAPNGRELIFYLLEKIYSIASPPNGIVEELNFYNHSPEQLSEMHEKSIKQGQLYFFTSVFRKYPNSTSPVPNRIVHGVGAWKAPGKSADITFKNKKIGSKLLLHFKWEVEPNAHRIRANWVMEEYKTGRQSREGAKLYDWVLCKVYQVGEAGAIPNNQTNQAVELEHPIPIGDGAQQSHPRAASFPNIDRPGDSLHFSTTDFEVQTYVVGVPQGDMVLPSNEIGTTSEVQQNNNNNSNVRDGRTNELMMPCQLISTTGTSEVVAEGTLLSADPHQLVGGVTLGELCWAVLVNRVVKNECVFRYAPTSNFRFLEDAIGGTIAWPLLRIRLFPLCTLYDWTMEHRIAVAEAAAVCQDPSTIVNGCPLGLECWKFILTRVLGNGRLFRDMPGGFQYLDDALVGWAIMWPWRFINMH